MDTMTRLLYGDPHAPRVHTPWGEAQTAVTIAPGITRYTTASHGGIHLSADRLREMRPPLRAIGTWAGESWYEEDCDWALVALAFPRYFNDYAIVAAIETVRGSDGGVGAARHWLDHSATGQALELRAARWKKAHAQHYRRGSMSTSGNGWHITARSVDGSTRLHADLPGNAAFDLPEPFTREQAEALGMVRVEVIPAFA